MRTLNSKPNSAAWSISTLAALFCMLLIVSCEKSNITEPTFALITKANALEHSIDLEQVMDNIQEVEVEITTRSSGFDAIAKGRGTIPSGEYAGHRFNVVIEAFYSGIGAGTLVTGEATVRIRGNHFASVEICDAGFESFCSGEGSLSDFGTHWEFTMFGQVEHLRAGTPHNHLFAGFGSTAGTMNFNIANQTGSVTEDPVGPNHDPDIGLITDITARPVSVNVH